MAKAERYDDEGGWVKIFRRFLKWEWYDDTNMVRLFLHLLLRANYEDKKWHGITVKKGQLICSLSTLAKETHLTTRNLRTCLQRLIETKEIDKQTTSKYTILTICKYDSYQQVEEPKRQTNDKQATSKRQASDKQATTTQEYKESKEEYTLSLTLKSNARAHARFVEWLKKECPYIYAHLVLPTEEQLDKLKEEYTSEEIAETCQQIENRTDLRKRYKNLYLTLLKWLKLERQRNGQRYGQTTTNGYGQGDNAQFLQQAAAYISTIRDGDFDSDRPPV